jgi:hypothetical protein
MNILDLQPLLAGALDAMTDDELRKIIRATRNHLLQGSDWTQLADSPLTDARKQLWADYRQQLRDLLESSPGDLLAVEFPTPPN